MLTVVEFESIAPRRRDLRETSVRQDVVFRWSSALRNFPLPGCTKSHEEAVPQLHVECKTRRFQTFAIFWESHDHDSMES